MDNGVREMEFAVQEKSFAFAVRIVKLCKYLRNEKREFALADQLLRSGTSIGANVSEAQQAQSKSDFIHKMSIAIKEAYETNYWLRLLHATNYISDKAFHSVIADCSELEKILIVIIKSSKEALENEKKH